VKLLLDTHVALWWNSAPTKLGAKAKKAIEHAACVYVSSASVWEVANKVAAGKLRLPGSFAERIRLCGFLELSVSFEHAELVARLPLHHADPFDRMLVAQAMSENLTLVTSDEHIERYAVKQLPAR
jgi:PIN domain nuclease of toxin-antitoxin system